MNSFVRADAHMKKNVTLSLNDQVYKKYRTFCDKHAIALSKSIEKFMKEKIEND